MFTDHEIDIMNKDADLLSDKIDEVLSTYVADKEDTGTFPFVALAALATVLTKLTVVMNENRDAIFDLLKDLMPENDKIQEIIKDEIAKSPIVVPGSDRIH